MAKMIWRYMRGLLMLCGMTGLVLIALMKRKEYYVTRRTRRNLPLPLPLNVIYHSTKKPKLLVLQHKHTDAPKIQKSVLEKYHRDMKSFYKDSKIKLFCMIKTQPKNIETKAMYVKNTWAKKCDKSLFISTVADRRLPAVGVLPHKNESRNILAEKVFAGHNYVYKHYANKYDWYLVCDDDTYVIVENLRYFLSSKNPRRGVFFGHRLMKHTPQGFSSGGSGFVMSREAMRRFGVNGHKHQDCNQTNKVGMGSDLKMGKCLYKLGVKLGLSTDSKKRSRFHCLSLNYHLIGPYPEWYVKNTREGDGSRLNDISDYPITFHYTSNMTMHFYDQLLFRTRIR